VKAKAARRYLKRVTYKPGTILRIERGYYLRLYTKVPDSRGKKHKRRWINTWRALPHLSDRGITKRELMQAVLEVTEAQEEHEQMEWLRFDGELLADPHDD
jgi:hypothetical protein